MHDFLFGGFLWGMAGGALIFFMLLFLDWLVQRRK